MGKLLFFTSSDICPTSEKLKYNYRPSTKLREGNVFTGCVSFCPQGVYDVTSCLVAWSHVPSAGVWCHFLFDCLVPCSFLGEGSLSRRGSSPEGVSIQCRGHHPGGFDLPSERPPGPPGLISSSSHQRGQYASYWNAFLFHLILWILYSVISYVWRFMQLQLPPLSTLSANLPHALHPAGVCNIHYTLQEHQGILTYATVSKVSDWSISMGVYVIVWYRNQKGMQGRGYFRPISA